MRKLSWICIIICCLEFCYRATRQLFGYLTRQAKVAYIFLKKGKKKKQQQQKQYIHLTIIVCHTSFGSYETSFVHFDGWNEHFEFIYKYEQSDRHSRRFQIRDPWKRRTERKKKIPERLLSVLIIYVLSPPRGSFRVKHWKYFPEGHWRF